MFFLDTLNEDLPNSVVSIDGTKLYPFVMSVSSPETTHGINTNKNTKIKECKTRYFRFICILAPLEPLVIGAPWGIKAPFCFMLLFQGCHP